jgi:hypothetical protein
MGCDRIWDVRWVDIAGERVRRDLGKPVEPIRTNVLAAANNSAADVVSYIEGQWSGESARVISISEVCGIGASMLEDDDG